MKNIQIFFASVLISGIFSVPVFWSLFFDDAYIHARIVRYFLEFGEPTFLLGETFKASSSTGYTLLVSLLSLVVGPIFAIQLFQVGAIFLFVFGSMLVFGLSDRGSRLVIVVAILASAPYLLVSAYGGMETSILPGLVLLFLVFYKARWCAAALFSVAVAASIRLEFLALLLPIMLMYLLSGRGRDLLPSIALLSAIFLFDIVFYQEIIPHASMAKSLGYNHPILQSFIRGFSAGGGLSSMFIGAAILTTCILGIFTSMQLLVAERNFSSVHHYQAAFAVASFAVVVSWAFSRSNLFPWYFAILVSMHLGLLVLAAWSNQRKNLTLIALSMLVILAMGNKGAQRISSMFSIIGINSTERVQRYIDIGSALYGECPECKMLTSEIGGLGWSFEGTVYDGFGLGDPVATAYHPMSVPQHRSGTGVGAIPSDYILMRSPDFVVSMPVFIQHATQSGTLDGYRIYECPIYSDGSSLWGDTDILIFAREVISQEAIRAADCYPVEAN